MIIIRVKRILYIGQITVPLSGSNSVHIGSESSDLIVVRQAKLRAVTRFIGYDNTSRATFTHRIKMNESDSNYSGVMSNRVSVAINLTVT